MTSQLLIVEGLPGCGKSTFSHAISIAAARAGRAVRWYSELEVNHPLAHAYPSEEGQSVESYFAACRSRWLGFFEAEARRPERTVIVEAWFLQDLRMTRFYVERNDESSFATSRHVRGMPGLIQFWTEHRAICDAVVDSSTLRTLRRDVSAYDWAEATQEILSAFDLEVPWADDANLTPFVGSYVLGDAPGSTFDVVERAQRLYLARFPFFWRSAETPLRALGGSEFAVESWPASVRFETVDGVVRSLIVSEHQRFGQAPWPAGSYARIASTGE